MAIEIPPYRRVIRPVVPESFPRYVEQELDKIGRTLEAIRLAVLELQTAVEALTP